MLVDDAAAAQVLEQRAPDRVLVDRADARMDPKYQSSRAVRARFFRELVVHGRSAEPGRQDLLEDPQHRRADEGRALGGELLEAADLGQVDPQSERSHGAAAVALFEPRRVAQLGVEGNFRRMGAQRREQDRANRGPVVADGALPQDRRVAIGGEVDVGGGGARRAGVRDRRQFGGAVRRQGARAPASLMMRRRGSVSGSDRRWNTTPVNGFPIALALAAIRTAELATVFTTSAGSSLRRSGSQRAMASAACRSQRRGSGR